MICQHYFVEVTEFRDEYMQFLCLKCGTVQSGSRVLSVNPADAHALEKENERKIKAWAVLGELIHVD